MRTRFRSLSILSLAGLLVLGACGGDNDKEDEDAADTSTASTIQAAGVSAVVRGQATASNGMEVEVDDNYFEPNIITGTAGQSVELELASEGKSLHNFSLTEQNVSQDVTAGSKVKVTVKFPASGELSFFCKYHKDEAGMAGVLRVSP
jgi:plastocyanin